MIRRIHVTYALRGVTGEQRKTVERVQGFHADYCPVAKSIKGSINITTDVRYL